jgi:hypothetical protein
MKIKFSQITSLVLLSVIILTVSCHKDEIYPIIPVIKFKGDLKQKSIYGKDSALKLTISYTDGDGDLGLKQEDIYPPFDSGSIYYYNMYVYYYELINGKWTEVTLTGFPGDTDTIRFKYRFPNLTPNADNKAIKGDIEYSITNLFPRKSNYIRFKFYIYDRMLHKSNVDSTGTIYYNPY